jgi:hypothetical protein
MTPEEKRSAIKDATAQYKSEAPPIPFDQGKGKAKLSETLNGQGRTSADKSGKAARVKQLVQEGKTDEEIKAAIKKEFP